MGKIELTKNIFGELDIDDSHLKGIYGPKSMVGNGLSDEQLYRIISNPIGCASLKELCVGKKKILIVTDDNTRQTPVKRILPIVFDELSQAGIEPHQIDILIGLGTHRPMSSEEITDKFGPDIAHQYNIINHAWDDKNQLVSLGECELGFEVVLNRLATKADFILSIGSIVPHATAGFSGGGKTIMPGICGEKTIEATHWAALDYSMAEILGKPGNKVQNAIVAVSKNVNLAFVINTILYDEKTIYGAVAGTLDDAYKKGVEICKELYGIDIPCKADIVIAEAYPTDIDLRQAIKAVCSADLVCKDQGVLILPADCPEGVCPQFSNFTKFGFRNPEILFDQVEKGLVQDKLLAYTLVAIGRIISHRLTAVLVSNNISKTTAEELGFKWAPDLVSAWQTATQIAGGKDTLVLKKAGEILPLLDMDDQDL